MAKKHQRPRRRAVLNARQAAFVRHYTAGADGVRGNAARAYIAAGYSPKDADVSGPRLLGNVGVRAAIKAAHQKADSAATARLRDWKELAPEAQDRLLTLMRGQLPDAKKPTEGRAMTSRTDTDVARIVQAAASEIIERAFPRKLQVELSDPRAALAQLLGVDPTQLPDPEAGNA